MKILTYIFDIIFPPRTNEVLLRAVSELGIKNRFSPRYVHNTICLTTYQEPLVRALITENKYHENQIARTHLSTLLQMWLSSQATPIVLIPIPLSLKRHRMRGYNQVTIVLEALHKDETVSIDTTSLRRRRHTNPQTTLGRDERLANLTGAFICDGEKIHSYQHCTLVIVDDVLTTGATMLSAKAALEHHLHPTASLLCLAFAH